MVNLSIFQKCDTYLRRTLFILKLNFPKYSTYIIDEQGKYLPQRPKLPHGRISISRLRRLFVNRNNRAKKEIAIIIRELKI